MSRTCINPVCSSGYYGSYPVGPEAWYSWGSSPPAGRPASQWGPGYSTEPLELPPGVTFRPDVGARDLSRQGQQGQRGMEGHRLGINTNIYSLYQGQGRGLSREQEQLQQQEQEQDPLQVSPDVSRQRSQSGPRGSPR